MLANKRDGVDADVAICENVLFFGIHAAVQSAHAKKVKYCTGEEKCGSDSMFSWDGVTYMRKASIFTAPDAQCASNRPLVTIVHEIETQATHDYGDRKLNK